MAGGRRRPEEEANSSLGLSDIFAMEGGDEGLGLGGVWKREEDDPSSSSSSSSSHKWLDCMILSSFFSISKLHLKKILTLLLPLPNPRPSSPLPTAKIVDKGLESLTRR